MATHPLIDAATLRARLSQPGWVVVDCRFNLLEPAAGRVAYEHGHIPGARYADLDRDLARPPAPSEGRHPLPDVAAFAATLGDWGIGPDDTIVAYDDANGAIAARLWWLLGWVGHRGTALVLDGGFPAWQAAQLPIETALPAWQPTRYPAPRTTAATVVDTNDIPARQRAGSLVVDARGNVRYRGEQEPIDPVAGHVPGARNWPFSNNSAAGVFRPRSELRSDLLQLLEGREPQHLIAMCGSGVTACQLLLAMAVAGLEGGKLYAGSWSEWIRDPKRPIATGAEP
ncbi:MAG: sulfurtransferase [Gammaproteobacteria bacterium]